MFDYLTFCVSISISVLPFDLSGLRLYKPCEVTFAHFDVILFAIAFDCIIVLLHML